MKQDDAQKDKKPGIASRHEAQKELVDNLKVEWKLMWDERFDDKTKAEGVSTTDYNALWIERGTIIHATKDYKALNFKEILEKHLVEDPEKYLPPPNSVGGWNKFIKTKISSEKKRPLSEKTSSKKAKRQPKKGGRGWLHTTE